MHRHLFCSKMKFWQMSLHLDLSGYNLNFFTNFGCIQISEFKRIHKQTNLNFISEFHVYFLWIFSWNKTKIDKKNKIKSMKRFQTTIYKKKYKWYVYKLIIKKNLKKKFHKTIKEQVKIVCCLYSYRFTELFQSAGKSFSNCLNIIYKKKELKKTLKIIKKKKTEKICLYILASIKLLGNPILPSSLPGQITIWKKSS